MWKSNFSECDCGCNDPVATTPGEMLLFLADRLEYAGVSEGVAAVYARDIRSVLEQHFPNLIDQLKPRSNSGSTT